MEEEDFPRRTRSKGSVKSEQRVTKKNTKQQDDVVLFKVTGFIYVVMDRGGEWGALRTRIQRRI